MGIINKMVQNVINENMMEYSSYVIKQRALPDLRDGMKPVYRRILWTMNKMGATKFTKSQNVSGQVMKYHPHGDSYPTIVGLVQEDNNLTPFINGKGSFGQRTSSELQPAAARYTEVKLSDIAVDVLKETNKDVVEFIPNYDGTEIMPEILPVKFPSILHIPQSGIAVGMSCNIPSFNLIELNDATIKYIKTGETSLLIPDFPTGGKVMANEEMFKKINETGQGSIRLRAKATVDKNVISITEIPYSTTREKIIDKIIELKRNGRLPEITDVKDLTGLYGMKIEITTRKNADTNMILEKLYQLTPLESGFGSNINVIHEELPKQMGVWEIIKEWTNWRKSVVKRSLMNEIQSLEKELHLLKGLEKVLLDIDKTIEIIRFADNVETTIMDYFDVDEIQANAIVNIKLKNINEAYISKQIKDIKDLEKMVFSKKEILNCDSAINNIICSELETVNKKYGQPRKTEIVEITEKVKAVISKIKNEVPDYAVKIIVTKEGYVKKIKTSSNAAVKLKDGDEVIYEFTTLNKHDLVVFAGTNAHIVKINSLNECKPSQLGDYLPTVLGVDKIIAATVVDDKNKFIMALYDNHRITKVDLSSFVTTRKKLANSLYTGGKLLKMFTFEKEEDMVFILKNGKEKKFNTADFNSKTKRDTQGNLIGKTIIDMKKA